MDKHAYLVMAHCDFESLRCLLKALDDSRNDIYLHIDKKTKNVPLNEIRTWVRRAELIIMPRMKIYWGHSGIIKCELLFFKTSVARCHYNYYHVISGMDFPLKSQDEIHDFFKGNDKEYLTFYEECDCDERYMYKIRIYHPFMKWIGRVSPDLKGKKKIALSIIYKIDRRIKKLQEITSMDRTKRYPDIHFVKGDGWFSISDDFARYIVSKEKEIKKMYALTNCPDEFFMATAAFNSRFKDRIAGNCLREIDWNRGNPYEYKLEDLGLLKQSSNLFARKISFSHEPELVLGLMEYIGCEMQSFM